MKTGFTCLMLRLYYCVPHYLKHSVLYLTESPQAGPVFNVFPLSNHTSGNLTSAIFIQMRVFVARMQQGAYVIRREKFNTCTNNDSREKIIP